MLTESGNEVNTDLLSDTPFYKLYSTRTITLATFFCGILAGAFMMAQNFKELNEDRKATQTWLITAAVVTLMVASLFVPAMNKVPSIAYSALVTVFAGSMAKKYQSEAIAKHLEEGGELQPNGKIVITSIICLLIFVALFVGVYYIATFLV